MVIFERKKESGINKNLRKLDKEKKFQANLILFLNSDHAN